MDQSPGPPKQARRMSRGDPHYEKLELKVLVAHNTLKVPFPKTALKDWDLDHNQMRKACAVSLGFPTDQGPIIRPNWGPQNHLSITWQDQEFRIVDTATHDIMLGASSLEILAGCEKEFGSLACYARLLLEEEQRMRAEQQARDRVRRQNEKVEEDKEKLKKLEHRQQQPKVVSTVS